MKRTPALTKNEMRREQLGKFFRRHFAGVSHLVEHGFRRGEGKGKLLRRRRSSLLQMVGADIGRVPFRNLARGVDDDVLDQPERGLGRKHIGAARQIFLDDVVLHRAGELAPVDALLVGERHIERQEPGGGGVDGHRGVHLAERNALHQRPHVAEMGDRHAHLAHLAAGERIVGVVSGLRRQVESDRKPRLAL